MFEPLTCAFQLKGNTCGYKRCILVLRYLCDGTLFILLAWCFTMKVQLRQLFNVYKNIVLKDFNRQPLFLYIKFCLMLDMTNMDLSGLVIYPYPDIRTKNSHNTPMSVKNKYWLPRKILQNDSIKLWKIISINSFLIFLN